jgi:hypothetical protein
VPLPFRVMDPPIPGRVPSGPPLAVLVLAIILAGCHAAAGDVLRDPDVARASIWRGDLSAVYGAAHANPCVADVAGALEALPRRGRPIRVRLGARQVLSSRLTRHAQGVARLPDAERTLVISRSGGGVGALIARLPLDTASDAVDLRATIASPPPLDHGGGIQALGRLLLVPYENKRDPAAVLIYDMTDPDAPRLVQRLDRSTARAPSKPTHASNVAAARLAGGRVLVVVGTHSTRVLDFYVTDGADLSDPGLRWTLVATLFRRVATGMQGTALVTQCDGTLFFLGVANTRIPPPAGGRDKLYAYRLDAEPAGVPVLTPVVERRMDCAFCNFAAGAGPYVDAAGRLRLYAVPHVDRDGELVVEEFTAPD